MTDTERAVIDAARALEPVVERLIASLDADGYGYRVAGENALRSLEAAARPFLAAVRALPRPLSEQLAELRVGAAVETDELRWRVFVNCSGHEVLLCRPFSDSKTLREAGKVDVVPYACIRRIISNPEASNG